MRLDIGSHINVQDQPRPLAAGCLQELDRASLVIEDFVTTKSAAIVKPNEQPLRVNREHRVSLETEWVNEVSACATKVGRLHRRAEEFFQLRAGAAGQYIPHDVAQHLLPWRNVACNVMVRSRSLPCVRVERSQI